MRSPAILLALVLLPAVPAAPVDLPQDDAGTRADAPGSPAGAPLLAPGWYQGNLTAPLGEGTGGDNQDWFAADLPQGTLTLRAVSERSVCVSVWESPARTLVQTCPVGTERSAAVDLPHAGRYLLRAASPGGGTYSFSFAPGPAGPPADRSVVADALGTLVPSGSWPRPDAAGDDDARHDAVIAFIDDGINPYHAAFRDDSPRAYAHPATYVEGFPADAEAIRLTFGFATLEDALAADCAEWAKVEPGKLYWFPGTRVTAITLPSFDLTGAPVTGRMDCADPTPKPEAAIVGTGGHGTMVASRAAGNGYGACPGCLVTMVQGFGAQQVAWAAAQPWIDVQSNSWGPVLPGYAPVPANLIVSDADLVRTIEDAARRQPSFWASGNGVAFRQGVLGHPTQLAPHLGPSAIRVGGHDSGHVALWPGSSPHVVSDAEASWAASHEKNDVSTEDEGGGTSGATPYAAGVAARILRDSRIALDDPLTGPRGNGVLAAGAPVGAGPLADGVLTRDELMRAFYATADARPDRTREDGPPGNVIPYQPTPLQWRDVPEALPLMPLVGYGAVTRDTGDDALAVLLGERPMPDRSLEDAWFEADREFRAAAYAAYAAR